MVENKKTLREVLAELRHRDPAEVLSAIEPIKEVARIASAQLQRQSQCLVDEMKPIFEAVQASRRSGAILRNLVKKATSEAEAERGLSPNDMRDLREQVERFERTFARVAAIKDEDDRQTAFDLAIDALFVGFDCGIPRESVDRLRREEQKQRQSNGGKKSGEVRRELAKWKPHAKELAVQIRNGKWLSQEHTASEIIARWKDGDHKNPSHRTLVKFISELEKTGDISATK